MRIVLSRPLFRLGAIFTILALIVPPAVEATSVKSLDLKELAEQASLIADVNVTATQSYWAAPSGGSAIRTRVTFTVNKLVKGQTNSPFTLEYLGGQVGNQKMAVAGMPVPKVGERLIIFAHGPSTAYVSPFIGFDQGALRVIRDRQTNVDRVFRWWGQPVKQTESFKTKQPVSALVSSAEQLRSADSVDAFLNRVQKILHP
jgi:hypothetical protein